MLRKRIKYFLGMAALGCVWFLLLWIGFLAMDYQDDILLSTYVIAGASGFTALIAWAWLGK